jgi:hypothetical protein
MTTIAWDGKTLAADTLATGTFNRKVTKIWELRPDVYFGGSGIYSEVYDVMTWLKYHKQEEAPDVKEFVGILIEKGKAYRIEENLIEVPITEEYHAIGTGACFAIAALHLGLSAIDAVSLAAKFDENTGGEITSMDTRYITSKFSGLG